MRFFGDIFFLRIFAASNYITLDFKYHSFIKYSIYMQHWIFISSTKRFRMSDWLAENDVVEYEQRNKICVNDIVYLYTTAPVQRIEFKMIVEKIDIPWEGTIDDSRFSLLTSTNRYVQKSVRLRLLEKADTPLLHLTELRKYGLKSSMQSHFKISGELLDYIESFFEK